MKIKCCKDCVAPKRYPGCHSVCPEYIHEKELWEKGGLYNLNKDKSDWWQMVQLLPSSYNQRRTVTMTYENVMNILDYRQGHKLSEWNEYCDILMAGLPYVADLRNTTQKG